MRKEEIRSLVVYMLLIVLAIIFGFAFVKDAVIQYGPTHMKPFPYLLVTVVLSYLINALGLELLHVLGAAIGGYSITYFNVLWLCFYKEENKWKFGLREFNGLSGETRFAPKREKKNINWVVWFPLFGFAIELATCIVIHSQVKTAVNPGAPWLGSASLILLLISSLLAFYNFIPLKLETMTDGYRIRLFSNPVNVKAYNEMLEIQEKRRLGKSVEKIPVFSEITEYTAEINVLAMYKYLEQEQYKEAEEIIDVLLQNEKVLSLNDYYRLIAQKIYLAILCKPIEEARQLYNDLCSSEVRRFMANDVSMPSIRAYILIAGMLEGSESEVLYAKGKVEKAKRRALASEVKTEEQLLNKAIDYVYENHPKWVKDKENENSAE